MASTVFRHYDQAALDREYDNRGKVADFAAYMERYKAASAALWGNPDCRLDVAFGPTHDETLDIFPAGENTPVHIFIHGGYWKMLSKNEFSYVANAFVPKGVATVVINYGLIPHVSMDELVRQCRAAVAWTWRHATSFGGDPAHIYVSGHSAGGHLTAMMMATDWPSFEQGLPADLVKGGCGISGLYDLEPIRLCFLNDDLKLTPQEAARNSPVQLHRHNLAPLLLPVGALEGPEYLRQSNDLAAAWDDSGMPLEVMVMKDMNHFSIVEQLNRPDSELSRAIHRQMGTG
jgi:arylformamidase